MMKMWVARIFFDDVDKFIENINHNEISSFFLCFFFLISVKKKSFINQTCCGNFSFFFKSFEFYLDQYLKGNLSDQDNDLPSLQNLALYNRYQSQLKKLLS